MTKQCAFCGVLVEYGHADWCKVNRAPTAAEVAQAVINEEQRSVGYEGPSQGLADMAKAFLRAAAEPRVAPKYRVHVQRNVIGQDAGLGYPENCKLVPYGPEFDTEDAAKLWVMAKGWMPIWWNVQQVTRPAEAAGCQLQNAPKCFDWPRCQCGRALNRSGGRT